MRDGMRHQAVLVLGFVLLAPVMACASTAEPLPDIDAAVAARVVEERVSDNEGLTSTEISNTDSDPSTF